MNKSISSLLCIFLIYAASGCGSGMSSTPAPPAPTQPVATHTPTPPKPTPTVETAEARRLEHAISAGIDFLYQSQLPYGEFKTYACSNEEMTTDCFFDSSPFVTTFVLYSTSFVDDPKVKGMTEKAISFFLDEMESPGLWRYWTSRNDKSIDPDLDDTSCISYILVRNEVPFESNLDVFLANKDDQGKFYTWVRDPDRPNDLDCVVNANVLLYLGENEDTKGTCQYLNTIVSDHQEDNCSPYYPDRLSFYYMLSRSYFNGISCLQVSRDPVVERVISAQKDDGSFGNDLFTALAVCTLLNFDNQSPSAHKAVKYILNAQMENGSWSKSVFFIGPAPSPYLYFGSEELTTAFCIEALARYQLLINGTE